MVPEPLVQQFKKKNVGALGTRMLSTSTIETKERMTCSTKLLIADRRLRGNPGEEDF